MLMPDVNILVYAHREETAGHDRFAAWITEMAVGPEPFAVSELAVHGFLRIVTNPRIFRPPSAMKQAMGFVDSLLARPGCCLLRPGPNHWNIFRQLCERGGLQGKIVADAVHAALAIENGCEWVTADTDFGRFAPPLRWRHL
jgi:uncharacterized protein